MLSPWLTPYFSLSALPTPALFHCKQNAKHEIHNEQPNATTPNHTVGTIHGSPTPALQPNLINPLTVHTATGITITKRNSGSYKPPFLLAMALTTMSEARPAAAVPSTPPIKGEM
ncbi:hypothetical protein B0T25DRAFT_533335 [Lasiosphaeria hispida]|uniref:Uncharacterized protein n=1 Tax=Lasiosphaeria hispida TaxID=260671 RepID=A0AAJ0MHS2_9PEZI|nr:hypothetical protein B0T25DRAFT_533335 [Lasiosphaeria hispida]